MMGLSRRLAFRAGLILLMCLGLIVICNLYLLNLHIKSQLPKASNAKRRESDDSARVEKNAAKDFAVVMYHGGDGGGILQNGGGPSKSLVDQVRKAWRTIKWSLPPATKKKKWPVSPTVGVQALVRSPMLLDEEETRVWSMAEEWVTPRQVYPRQSQGLSRVLDTLATAPIVGADVGTGGTQLKLTLTLRGGQKVVFKPMRYTRDALFTDTPYAGADRHNGEIAAYHLSRLLDLRWCPLVSGRKVNLLTEILPVAETALKRTFFERGNDTCFYGLCHYCKPEDPACAAGHILEGAVILWLPLKFKLRVVSHPWRRTYRRGHIAPWEADDDYCRRVVNQKSYKKPPRLLDLIDIAIFDFLIGNADRHVYEVMDGYENSIPIMLDNGKSFGNPHEDEVTILAPLYQCCRVRRSTWQKLQDFSDNSLSEALDQLMRSDVTYPVLTEDHLLAIDRRRIKVLTVIERICLRNNSKTDVFADD